MNRRRLKLLLVEDYVELNKIFLVCDYFLQGHSLVDESKIFDKVVSLTNVLIKVYEKIFFRLGLMDVSLLVVKENFKKKSNLNKNSLMGLDLHAVYMKLKFLSETINFKLKKLSLNEIEMCYITKDLTFNGKD